MTQLYVEEFQEKPIKEMEITAIIKKKIDTNLKKGDKITFNINNGWFSPSDTITRTIKKIERIRLDELTTKQILKCGYTHKKILLDHLNLEDTGELYYYIEFQDQRIKNSHIHTHNCVKCIGDGKQCNSK